MKGGSDGFKASCFLMWKFWKNHVIFYFGLMNKELVIKFTQGFYGDLSIVFMWWCQSGWMVWSSNKEARNSMCKIFFCTWTSWYVLMFFLYIFLCVKIQKMIICNPLGFVLCKIPWITNGCVTHKNLPNSLGQILNKKKLKSVVWWTHVILGSWLGKGWPSLRCLAGLFGWSAALGLRHGLDSYGRQQWGILDRRKNLIVIFFEIMWYWLGKIDVFVCLSCYYQYTCERCFRSSFQS